MLIISPSLLAADFSELAQEVAAVKKAGAQYLHLDVMDGIFVPNISFGIPVIQSLRAVSDLLFDVHLMIVDPIRYIDAFAAAGADLITVHYESCDNLTETIRAVKSKNIRASVAIKPTTPAEAVFPLLADLDMVLVMTVEPGFGGQALIPETLEKVRAIRSYAERNGLSVDIQVDGGINADNLKYATAAGANVIVAGSAIFRAENPKAVIDAMREQAVRYPFGTTVS